MTDGGTALRMLAKHLGVQRAWRAYDGTRRVVDDDTLVTIIRRLGVPVEGRADAAACLQWIQWAERERVIEPVTVLWDHAPLRLPVVLPVERATDEFTVHVVMETGETASATRRSCRVGAPRREGSQHVTFVLEPPLRVPFGVHRIGIELSGMPTAWGTILAAPAHLSDPLPGEARRWGVFAPLYALHAPDRPVGDFSLLHRLSRWAARAGADAIGILPILASFSGVGREPPDAGPYAPVSRRFWNESYVDLAAVPEAECSADALAAPVHDASFVDPVSVARARRPVFHAAAHRLVEDPRFAARRHEFETWCASQPELDAYAAFRATVEAQGPVEPAGPLDPDAPGVLLHRYAQWLAHTQLDELASACRDRRQVLQLDLPIGTHRNGFDVWRRPEQYVLGAAIGAPPDEYNREGQIWGAPPLHPHVARLAGHDTFRRDLRVHFAIAPWLRIDHVMGLHRLWFVPEGASAADGAYVSYPADELYAVLCLEAMRAEGVDARGGVVIGENLGTVPHETNRALQAHRMLGTYVAEFELDDDGLRAPLRRSLATLDTHDTPTFATWWHGLDPHQRGVLLGQLRADGVLDTEMGELVGADDVLDALLTQLGASRAEIVFVALEDLWLEADPQNDPSAKDTTANFRRRCARGLDAVEADDELLARLRRVDEVRRRGLVGV